MSLVTPPKGYWSAGYGVITTYHHAGIGHQQGIVSGDNIIANRCWFMPVCVDRPVIAYKLCYSNHAGAATGNVDIGLYDAAGTRLVSSGSMAKTAVLGFTTYDIADLALTPGIYYLGFVSDTGTDTFQGVNFPWAEFGALYQGSTFPLPATATWGVQPDSQVAVDLGIVITAAI